VSWNYSLNLAAFAEPLSKEARYWIGFLLADGCVSSCRGYAVISLALKFEDAGHVIKFAEFVGMPEVAVKDYCYRGSRRTQLAFSGKELVGQLAKYGVVPRKSLIAAVYPDLAFDSDFWRGVVDGDGCLDMSHGPSVSLGGSWQVVCAFSSYLQALTGFKPAVSKCRSIFQTAAHGQRACIVVSAIYYDGGSVVLDRKMAIAKKFADWEIEKYSRGSGKCGGQFLTEQTERTLLEVET